MLGTPWRDKCGVSSTSYSLVPPDLPRQYLKQEVKREVFRYPVRLPEIAFRTVAASLDLLVRLLRRKAH